MTRKSEGCDRERTRRAGRPVRGQGARAVAEQAQAFAHLAEFARPALVNGAAGFVVIRDGRPFSVAGITVAGDRITEVDLLGDPKRLAELDLTVLDG